MSKINNHHSAIKVLALMPMLPGYEAVRETVAGNIIQEGFQLVWLEDLLEDWEWLDWLYDSVLECDVVVANPSEHNAFVMYELGIARPNGQPTLLMLDQENSQLSGSLDGSPFLTYANAELDVFSSRFRADLSALAAVVTNKKVLSLDPAELYRTARHLAECFGDETGYTVVEVNEVAFNARLNHSIGHGTFTHSLVDKRLGDAALLAALDRSSRMVNTMIAIREWVDKRDRG